MPTWCAGCLPINTPTSLTCRLSLSRRAGTIRCFVWASSSPCACPDARSLLSCWSTNSAGCRAWLHISPYPFLRPSALGSPQQRIPGRGASCAGSTADLSTSIRQTRIRGGFWVAFWAHCTLSPSPSVPRPTPFAVCPLPPGHPSSPLGSQNSAGSVTMSTTRSSASGIKLLAHRWTCPPHGCTAICTRVMP